MFGVNYGFSCESPNFRGCLAELEDCGRASTAAVWVCRAPGIEVHAHLQMDGYTGFAVLQLFDADDLGNVLAVHGVVVRGVRKGDEDAHAGIVGLEPGGEINSAF